MHLIKLDSEGPDQLYMDTQMELSFDGLHKLFVLFFYSSSLKVV